ncbi:uncharacterized protein LY89DRAFT_733044 [Mollisia scopiformis]|uniref:F-box domain-containing protein n=1 Tax=Mollisia scopiformis TaxID=149040 RepID=A0A194XDZ2_MOLSC|nr:uncharacterized protein LY89DRAFT_733044 [Mollisia scopiformis]KUJ18369.1 hypothetical protein LY89DRAFT_733044 [Mollisia scopiformis]
MAPARRRPRRRVRAVPTAASARPSRRAAVEATAKNELILARPKSVPKPTLVYEADREDKDSFFDNEVPAEIYKMIMDLLDPGSATCFGLVNRKAHNAWLKNYDYGDVNLNTMAIPAPGGLTRPLRTLLWFWAGPDLFFNALLGIFTPEEELMETYEDFMDLHKDEVAQQEREAEEREEEEEREREQRRYDRQQRRLHTGTVAHAHEVEGYSDNKHYNSDLEEENSGDEDDEDDEDDE